MAKEERTCAFSLQGQVALVTGCGSPEGIGFAIARLFLRQGASVAITSTVQSRVEALKARLESEYPTVQVERARVFATAADLTDEAQARRVVEGTVKCFGRLNILVNNAGMTQTGSVASSGSLLSLKPDDWARKVAITLYTAVHTTRAALPHMRAAHHGRVVMVSSVTGSLVSAPGSSAYSTAKAGLDGLMRAVAIEEGRHGITCNSVQPGWIETGSSEEDELVAGRFTPVGRMGRPDEVAAAVVFLATRGASYVTGTAIVVDGGNVVQEHHGPEPPSTEELEAPAPAARL